MCVRTLALALVIGCNGGGETDDEGPAAPQIVVNEFMAANKATLTDDTGAFSDWVELYNGGDEAQSLGGMFLSDDLGNPTMAALPDALRIEAGGFLVLFADAGLVAGDTHLPFALSAAGESLLLSYAPTPGAVETLDSVSFGPQDDDVSFARTADGAGEWAADDTSTPGETNL